MSTKKQKESPVRMIALGANEQEIEALERVKKFYRRKSNADAIRFLIKVGNLEIIFEQKNPPSFATGGGKKRTGFRSSYPKPKAEGE